MSYSQERIDIETRLQGGWKEAFIGYTTTAIAWENIEYVPTAGVPWIRCSILPGQVEALEFGRDTLKQFSGIIDLGVFIPRGSGTKANREYVDKLFTLFNLAEFDSIECDEARVQNLGIDESWYQTSISIPFTRREV